MNIFRTLRAATANPMKMVLVVRTDLGLRKGKIASQCAHGAVLCYVKSSGLRNDKLSSWLAQGQPKIVLKVDTLEGLQDLAERATTAGVVAAVVHDAGRTQVLSGTATVLGLGPDSVDVIDSLVRDLKLL